MGQEKGQRTEGEAATLYTDPPPSSAGRPLHHSTLPTSPPAAQQQPTGGGRHWGFLLAAVDSFSGRRSLSNLTIGTGPSKRNHHDRQPAPGEPPRRCCLPDSEYGFNGALSPSLFFWLLSSGFQRPGCCCSAPLPPQLVSARCYCHKPAAATARRGPARGGRGRDQDLLESPGQSTWDVHRCPAHCTACDAGGPSEAGRRHEKRDFCVDPTPASPASKGSNLGSVGSRIADCSDR